MNDLFKNTADQLRYALSQEWCDLYGHKTEWNKETDEAYDAMTEAYNKAYAADDEQKLTAGEIEALYDLAEAIEKDWKVKQNRVECLEQAMEAIEKLETLYSEDWKEVWQRGERNLPFLTN